MKIYLVSLEQEVVATCTDAGLADRLVERLSNETGLPDSYYDIYTTTLYGDISLIDEDFDAA